MGKHVSGRKMRSWAKCGVLAAVLLLWLSPVQAADRKTATKTFESSATHTPGTEYSSGFLVENYAEGVLLVSVSGVSGTPTVTITAETSEDNSTYYYHSTIATISATGATAYQVTNFGKYMRAKQVISGTSTTVTYTIMGVFKN